MVAGKRAGHERSYSVTAPSKPKKKLAKGPIAQRRLSQINPDYVDCRDLAHSWRRVDAVIDNKAREIRRVLVCTRCPMQRTQILYLDGTIKGNRYRGPGDYYLKGGQMTRYERAALRLRNSGL
jgi:hypothetical protein